jgi:hypothetical protein
LPWGAAGIRRRQFSGEIVMATHKYAAGQNVRFSPHRNEDGSARGVYTIVTRLPEEGNVPQYRIKAKTDGRERVVREDQLDRL